MCSGKAESGNKPCSVYVLLCLQSVCYCVCVLHCILCLQFDWYYVFGLCLWYCVIQVWMVHVPMAQMLLCLWFKYKCCIYGPGVTVFIFYCKVVQGLYWFSFKQFSKLYLASRQYCSIYNQLSFTFMISQLTQTFPLKVFIYFFTWKKKP